jgi:hypothetical protein
MVCLAYGIQIAPFHIPGVDNRIADVLSRHPDLHEDDTRLSFAIASYSLPPAAFIAMVTTHYEQLESRGILARTIVMAAVFRHSHYSPDEILILITLLARTSSYPLSAYAPRHKCDMLFALNI